MTKSYKEHLQSREATAKKTYLANNGQIKCDTLDEYYAVERRIAAARKRRNEQLKR